MTMLTQGFKYVTMVIIRNYLTPLPLTHSYTKSLNQMTLSSHCICNILRMGTIYKPEEAVQWVILVYKLITQQFTFSDLSHILTSNDIPATRSCFLTV